MPTRMMRVVHATGSHRADDVRIFDHKCLSLVEVGGYDVTIAAAGSMPSGTSMHCAALPPRPVNRTGPFALGPFDAWRFARSNEFGDWHSHDPEVLPVAIWLARRGRTVIWDAHEDYAGQFTPCGGKSWIPSPVRGVAQKLFVRMLETADRSVAGVVAATETIAARYHNPRTIVADNEALVSDFANCRPSLEARQLLFTGTVDDGPLFSAVIDAVESFQDVGLVVASFPPNPEMWAEAERRLGSRVRHVGRLGRQGLAEVISESSLGIVTYAPNHDSMDPTSSPTKLYEFAAAGLPMIVAPVANCTGRLEQSGAGVVAAGVASADLADAIHAALADPGRWSQMSQAGRAWASKHGSWEAVEDRLLNLYDDLTRGR